MPGHDYVREVPKLNMHANVSTVGYIRIDYCKKPLSEVYAEIEAYAGWSQYHEHAGLGVEGILLDETPNHYSEDRVEYLHAVGQHVKSTCGILGERLVSAPPERARLELTSVLSVPWWCLSWDSSALIDQHN